jgi:hypothetical protein
MINNLSKEDFAEIFNISSDDFSDNVKKIIEERNFEYTFCDEKEKEQVLLQILKRLNGNLSVSGSDQQIMWDKGWSENLESFKNDGDVNSLTPKFIKKYPALRLRGKYVKPVSDSFEFDFIDVYRIYLFEKYFENVSTIYEFGCGSCQHLIVLSKMFPDKEIVGLDWADSSQEIISELNKKGFKNIRGVNFNLFDPDYDFKLKENSAVLTIGTMEQMGKDFYEFIDYLIKNRSVVNVHLETIREFYDDNTLFGYLASYFDNKRNYLNGFYTCIKDLNYADILCLLKSNHLEFGNLYHDSYSLIVWK